LAGKTFCSRDIFPVAGFPIQRLQIESYCYPSLYVYPTHNVINFLQLISIF